MFKFYDKIHYVTMNNEKMPFKCFDPAVLIRYSGWQNCIQCLKTLVSTKADLSCPQVEKL